MIVDASVSTAVGALRDAGDTGVQATRPAEAGDVERFEAALLATPDAGPAPMPSIDEQAVRPAVWIAPEEAAVAAEAPPVSLGTLILDGMNSVRGRIDDAVTSIRGVLHGAEAELTVKEMMDIQMQISTLSIQQDLLGKIVGKSTQNLDQLLKAQ